MKTSAASRPSSSTPTLELFPRGVFGSPPCQDISSANTKGKGVDGERSALFFEAIRIAREIRTLAGKLGIPGARWLGLENSSNLRNRGSTGSSLRWKKLATPCEPAVVGAGDDFRTAGRKVAGVEQTAERAESWLLSFDPAQLADPHGAGRPAWRSGWRSGIDLSVSHDPRRPGRRTCWRGARRQGQDGDSPKPAAPGHAGDAAQDGRGSGRPWGRIEPASRAIRAGTRACRPFRRRSRTTARWRSGPRRTPSGTRPDWTR